MVVKWLWVDHSTVAVWLPGIKTRLRVVVAAPWRSGCSLNSWPFFFFLSAAHSSKDKQPVGSTVTWKEFPVAFAPRLIKPLVANERR